MVKLTVDIICRGTSGYTKRKRDEPTSKYLKRLTHLYLEGRLINEVGEELSLCRNLSVLYLYDNALTCVPDLRRNGFITHLYLQNNCIERMENLQSLHKLTKLYLGNNRITVVEGLDKIPCLQELHIEQQKLPPGEKLLFDPRTLKNISKTLEVLNISGNRIDNIIDLIGMQCLTQFMAGDNLMIDTQQIENCLARWRYLRRLELIGNPFCHKPKYRDHVILMGTSLESLDGKEVTQTAKTFLKNWYSNKEALLKKKESIIEFAYGDTGEMPPLSHANLSGFLMPALPKRCTTRSNIQTAPAKFPQPSDCIQQQQQPLYMNNAYPNRMTAPLNGNNKLRSAHILHNSTEKAARI